MTVAVTLAEDPERRERLAAALVRWQAAQGRHDLPWQRRRDPYGVWLSEVMLQQTQVATVRGYYERFLQRFPDVQTLAAASLDEVLALWSGLGYYSRARHLHRCAQVVVQQHGGQFPQTAAALASLPGIGRSTAAAIAVFCFGERVAILDGNVRRVLARLFGLSGDPTRPAVVRQWWELAESLVPAAQPQAYTQGLMDLGAGVCLPRRPQCERCCWLSDCRARAEGQPERYPQRVRRTARGERETTLLWLRHRGRQWLVRRPARGVWAALWSLPEMADRDALDLASRHWPGQGRWLPPLRHALTHFDWTLQTLCWDWPAEDGEPDAASLTQVAGAWYRTDQALALGLPVPVRHWLGDAS